MQSVKLDRSDVSVSDAETRRDRSAALTSRCHWFETEH